MVSFSTDPIKGKDEEVVSDSKIQINDTNEVVGEVESAKDESLLWKTRKKVGDFVNNDKVQIFIIVCIMVNALMMAIGTFEYIEDNPQRDKAFQTVDKAFLILFSIEASMQLFYFGFALFLDGWLVFDLAIVILSWSFESLQIVRAFRIFRAFRLVTRVKPLRDLVLAIGAVLPRMYAIAALLLLVFYIFAVLFTELFSDLNIVDEDGNQLNFFGTLDASLFTCMEMMTLEWGEIMRLVMLESGYPWTWVPFVCFIAITGFIVFNLIVAVVCDAVAVTEKTVRKMEGFEEDDTEIKLLEAQERIDLLQSHINDMVKIQENTQKMMEIMAEELLYLQTERLNAEQREALLREEVEERRKYQDKMEAQYEEEKKRREELRESVSVSNLDFEDFEEDISIMLTEEDHMSEAQQRRSRLVRNISKRMLSDSDNDLGTSNHSRATSNHSRG